MTDQTAMADEPTLHASAEDDFAIRTLTWWDQHGRKDLPWQHDKTPYRVWVSEIMLQQTQVTTVIPYYERFMARFPDVATLACSGVDDVLHLWTGLGYYARGRNLHKAAIAICEAHGGELPGNIDQLQALPGIGASTAAAILAISRNEPQAILDGNVKRVLARFHGVDGWPGTAAVAATLWQHARKHTPAARASDYTQAIMDLGATCCTRTKPNCPSCPHASACVALNTGTPEQYPGKKPKKDKPERHARMYLIVRPDGACLLERRPDNGIWGGLYSPPEGAADSDPVDVCAAFGIPPATINRVTVQPPFRHTFTHFHLHIEPVTVETDQPPPTIADDNRLRWVHPGSNEPLGLSAAAVKLLTTVATTFELT